MKTVYLRHPVILRTREDDPNGQQPVDNFGQPAKNRDGSQAKPFKIVEKSYRRGANIVDDAVADHPYIKACSVDAPRGAAEDFTIEQLESMLAEKRAAKLKPKKPGTADDAKGPLPWPSDDEISALKPAELRDLLTVRGGNAKGIKDSDLLGAVIDLKATQEAN